MFEFTWEVLTKKGGGGALIAGIGEYKDVSIIEAGCQYNYYLLGDFQNGLQLGAEGMFTYAWTDETYERSSASIGVISVGPYGGYKYATDEGLTFFIQGGKHFSMGGESIDPKETNLSLGLFINLNIGWSY